MTHSDAPICVTGMHRSGTSLTMRMLAALGVDLGADETQFAADPVDNPEGYQEHVPIVDLDDEILRMFDGHASEAPSLQAGWESSHELDRHVEAARDLLDELFEKRPWAFKDPRISLLLPFWRRVRPDLRVIVCVRSPIEVAESMERRGASYSRAHWLECWLAHTSAALAASADADRAIVLFEDVIAAPRKVADDLALFVTGEPPALEAREAAAAAVDPERRRSKGGAEPAGVPRDLARYYDAVRELARAQSRSRIAASVR